jgi:Do/DeqQ family serine protease
MRTTPRRTLLVLLVTLTAFLLAGCGKEKEVKITTRVQEKKAEAPVKQPPQEILATQKAFIEVARKVMPVAVNIRAERVQSMRNLAPLFREFFGNLFKDHPQLEQKEQILGSGFIFSTDGYILTNDHVIKGAQKIKVKLATDKVYDAKVVGSDPRTDVAVLKIDTGEKLPAAVLGDSDALQVGQWALAIGNPFGLGRTLTVGVVSATGRSDVGIEEYENFIQTDASINPGNSGGPLLNIFGEVIGINTAIVASGQGIGFAIPINLARSVAEQLIKTGKVTRGWLGVSIQALTPELAQSFGLETTAGALINQVIADSPAAKAGLRRGDILLSFNGKEVHGPRDLQVMVASTTPGTKADLEILRDGKREKISLTLGTRKPEEAEAAPAPSGQGQGLGLTVAPNPGGQGVVVKAVDPDSGAADAGVQPGDVILSVNREDVNDLASFRKAVEKSQKGSNVVLLIQRDDATIYLAFPVS